MRQIALFLTCAFLTISAAWPRAGYAQKTTPRSGLILWLDAGNRNTLRIENGHVRAWKNRAQTGGHWLSSEGEEAPLYVTRENVAVRAALRFDGENDVLRDLHFRRSANVWTLVVVAAPIKPVAGGGLCSSRSFNGNDYDPGFTVDLFQSHLAFDQINVEGAGRIGGQQDQMRSSCPPGELAVILVERDRNEIRLRVNGRDELARSVRPARTIMDEIRIGARFYAGTERAHFHGDIAEVLLYDRILTREEQTSMEESRAITDTERKVGKLPGARMVAPEVVKTWPSVQACFNDTARGKLLAPLPIR